MFQRNLPHSITNCVKYNVEEKEYSFVIKSDKLAELIQLTEERDMSKNVVSALVLYYEILRHQAQGYKLAMVPIAENKVDPFRNLVFINTEDL